METLMTNSLILSNIDDSMKRILWIDDDYKHVYTIDLKKTCFSPVCESTFDIEEDIKLGNSVLIQNEPFKNNYAYNQLSKVQQENRDKAWEVVSYILREAPGAQLYDSRIRGKIIRDAENKFSVSRTTINYYLMKYWQRGMSKNSLLPDYSNCGGKGKDKKNGNAKRGRKRKYSDIKGVNIDEEMKMLFQRALNKYFYNSKQNSIRLTYELMIRDYFSDELPDKAEGNQLIVNEEKIPTLGQFRYWFSKNRDYRKEISKRNSSKEYQLNHRPILGSSNDNRIYGIGEYQLDATILDFYVTSRYDSEKIIGRPTLYLIVDVFSRMITGVHISLENPSYNAAAVTIYNAVMSKVEYCKKIGIDITHDEWPCENLPNSIIADRGELEGKKIESLIENTGVKLINTPSYRGDLKGVVERYFNSLNAYLKPFIPGYVENDNFNKRNGIDYRLKAKLTMPQISKIIVQTAIHVNNSYMKEYIRDLDMVESGILPIPKDIWNWSVKSRTGGLRKIDSDILLYSLLPRETARVTKKGILFKGMLYIGKKTLENRWYEIAKNKKSWLVDIIFDPRNIKYIYIIQGNEGIIDKCEIVEHQRRYSDMSLEEAIELQEHEKRMYENNKNNELESRIELFTKIESIVDDRVKEIGKSPLKRNRLKGIAENKRDERRLERKESFFELEDISTEKTVNHIDIPESIDELNYDRERLIKRLQKELLDND